MISCCMSSIDLILSLFEIDDLDGNNLLGPIIDAFEHLAETTLPYSFLFREYQLGVHLLQQGEKCARLQNVSGFWGCCNSKSSTEFSAVRGFLANFAEARDRNSKTFGRLCGGPSSRLR